ncbi:hypothetical protein P9847_18670 [Paenibacillus chibensis]|uniref:Uncharacterized protein n=1 Tax=Paenibacillus chibensis TaxID=59846 RepID=A0ABU6PWU6_9BACL|nr:hypothetical protein [Paenibacillus chibensis]
MEDVNQPASHSEDVTGSNEAASHSSEEQELRDHYNAFGLSYPEPEQQEDESDEELEDADPAIDGNQEQVPERKGVTVKHNGQDVTVEDEQVPEYLQMGLNYKKVKGQVQQYESALDRLARQQGYKDHADLIENLDKIEQEAVQKQQNQFDQLKQHLRQEAEDAGIDPNVMEQYLDNHPLIKQAREVVQRSEQEQQYRQQEQSQQQLLQGWEALFKKYPQLADQVSPDGGTAPWLTPEMHSKLQRGYDPVDAYELVHRDSFMADERKRAEQSVLKTQRLNKRAQVEGQGKGDRQPEVPSELSSAFAAFGLDPKNAQKYAKNFESK